MLSKEEAYVIEHCLNMVNETITDLTQWKTDTEHRLDELKKIQSHLNRLLLQKKQVTTETGLYRYQIDKDLAEKREES